MVKKKEKLPKIIYYEDELNDDFAGTKINAKVVDNSFKFTHKGAVWTFFSSIVYYLFVIPIVWFYTKILLRVKFVNKKVLKPFKKKKIRYYIYGNHTSFAADAFSPNLLSFPTRNKILVSPDTVSIKGIKTFIQMLGAVPVPTDTSGIREFMRAVDYYHTRYNITIYPEAHIWPYFTDVRNFKDSSFLYPVKQNAPVFATFTAYTKPKGFLACFRKANFTTYISDPIYPDLEKPKKEAQKELRDKVFAFMKECSEKYSTYDVVKYKHISEKPTETKDKTMIKNIIFDIGGVIVNYKKETYFDYFNFSQETLETIRKYVSSAQVWKDLTVGKITSKEYTEAVIKEIPHLEKEVRAFSDNHNFIHMIPPFKATLEYINKLKNRGYKVFIISNITDGTIEYLNREIPGFRALFDDVVYSCEVGLAKPSDEIYKYAIERFNIAPEESLFIDDVQKNLDAANKNNIQTLKFETPEKSIPEIEKLLN